MNGLDLLLTTAIRANASDGVELMFGYTDADTRVYLEPGDTPLPATPPSLVALLPDRRFAALMSRKRLLILGHLNV